MNHKCPKCGCTSHKVYGQEKTVREPNGIMVRYTGLQCTNCHHRFVIKV